MNSKIAVIAVLTLALGAGAGYWLASQQGSKPAQQVAASSERKPLFYRNPMNPTVTSPVPAKDSMGMDYVPVYAEDLSGGAAKAGTVVIDPTVVQSIGVRTATAQSKTIGRHVRTTGRVDYDEELMARLHPKTDGWVGKQFINETGKAVKKDTILLSIYSPQLVSSEEEYLLALKNVETLKHSPFADIRRGATDLLRSSRERLELLDVPEHQIRELEKTRKIKKYLHIHSPFDGIVINISAREGQYVTPKDEIYMIADLSKAWVYVDIYEYELPWIRVGDPAEMKLAALPGQTFTGKVTYIYPYLDAKTRTNKVRLEFDNSDGSLKPDMFADVTIYASRKARAVVIPSQAVIRTGRKPKVFVQTAEGSFAPRSVELGMEANGEVEVIAGIEQGERVVTSAQFLIDSESSLKEAAAKMVAPQQGATKAPKHQAMEGMSMEDMSMEDGKRSQGHDTPKGAKHE